MTEEADFNNEIINSNKLIYEKLTDERKKILFDLNYQFKKIIN